MRHICSMRDASATAYTIAEITDADERARCGDKDALVPRPADDGWLQQLLHRDESLGARRRSCQREVRDRNRMIERRAAAGIHAIAQAFALPVREPAIERRRRP